MKCSKEFGVFLPIAQGGWIISRNTPVLDASYRQNREAALLADEIGLDFIMSMAKWRGFGGETRHWDASLESMTMMAGIAEATRHARVIATMHAGLHNPAVVAKMVSTLDQISGGRAGLNIVSGSFKDEFEQMGAWDGSLSHDERYAMTQEWTEIIKLLWANPQLSYDGKFFSMKECVSNPKPFAAPRPFLVCAGQSERGLQFSVRNTDACFIGGKDEAQTRAISLRAKALAAEYGTSIKTYCMSTVICADSDAQAEALARHYQDGIDRGAVEGMMRSFGVSVKGETNAMVERAGNTFMTHVTIGAADSCRRQLSQLLTDCELDGVMLIFPDYVDGLTRFGRDILPGLRADFS